MGIFSRRSRPGDQVGTGEAFELGMRLWRQGRSRESAKAFEEAARFDPRSVDAHFLFGASLMEAGELEPSIAPLAKCLELAPDHSDGHNTLAMVLGRLGRTDEGEGHLARAAFLGHPQAPTTLRGLGMGYCRRCGDPVERVTSADADVRFNGPRVGLECLRCPTVFCVRCVVGDAQTAVAPRCPECAAVLTEHRSDSDL